MKKFLVLTVMCLFRLLSFSQIEGEWKGGLNIQGMTLPLTFHIEKNEQGLSGYMDSPSQQAYGLPFSKIAFEDGKIEIEISKIGAKYSGLLNQENKTIVGTFNQNGYSFP